MVKKFEVVRDEAGVQVTIPVATGSPYTVLENNYWKQLREVCVVDEINCLPDEDAEVVCGTDPKNEAWVRAVADTFGFNVQVQRLEDSGGKYLRIVVSKKEGVRK
jgi:hypothetical protein